MDGRIFFQVAEVLSVKSAKCSNPNEVFLFQGFLGLLMGGSLLSLVEIFYHVVLKRIFKR